MSKLELKDMGRRIYNQRKSLGITREQMAEHIGKTPRFYIDIERGLRGMSIQTLVDISNALNLSTDYILTGSKTDKLEELDLIYSMARMCEPDKIKYLVNLVRNFVVALNNNKSE